MNCMKHPERTAVAVCEKNEMGFCSECLSTYKREHDSKCFDPALYCKYRTSCLLWGFSREKKKQAGGNACSQEEELPR